MNTLSKAVGNTNHHVILSKDEKNQLIVFPEVTKFCKIYCKHQGVPAIISFLYPDTKVKPDLTAFFSFKNKNPNK
jgi:hypothetical protein